MRNLVKGPVIPQRETSTINLVPEISRAQKVFLPSNAEGWAIWERLSW